MMLRKSFSFLLALTLLLSFVPPPGTTVKAAEQAIAQSDGTFENPLIWADVPDPDIIRVGDAYYMSSTTMHMNPGVPIMKSYDLVNWEIVNYVYDILADNDEQTLRNGKSNYGQGSWASSLRYHNGKFYVAFASYDTGKTYIYQTADIENGPWTSSTLDGVYHDMSLLFDDDGRVYMVYGGGNIRIVELNADATAIIPNTDKVIIPDASLVAGPNVGLPAEGAHIHKINGYYYIFTITWPQNDMRTQLVHRSSTIDGEYTGKVALRDAGVAQGGIIDTVDGKWYGLLFGDRGSVGRIPYLVPVTWEDNWPVFGVDGKVPVTMDIPVKGTSSQSNWVDSDEFYQSTKQVKAFHSQFELATGPDVITPPAQQPLTEGPELLANGGFEEAELGPWSGHENANVTLTTNEAFSGTNSLLVSNRQATGSGPQQSIAGKVKAGGIYKFSAKVKYNGDETFPGTKTFNIAFQDGDWQTIKVMGSGTITKGEWGTIEGTYTIPQDAVLNQPIIFIETGWTAEQHPVNDRMDFYVDEVSFEDVTPSLNLLVNGGFESGRDPWTVHENATLEVTEDESYSGTNSLFVSARATTGSGPQQSIAGKVTAGGVYKISAKVKYNGDASVPATKQFNLAFQDGDWQTIKIMGSGTITKGEWGTIEGTYTIPDSLALNEPLIFIETGWTPEQNPVTDRMDFYVDDVVLENITPAGGTDRTQVGEYDYNGSNLKLVWQWNHNPDNRNWSLTERPGYLRLTTGRKSTGLLDARNTLTQRTFGPESSGIVAMDVSKMKNGDYAGLGALQKEYGFVGVKMSGNAKSIVMVNGSTGSAVEAASVPLTQDRVYFKTEFDYKNGTDKAYFYYSLDGADWTAIGDILQLRYTLPHFMGYRFALFNYATISTGGQVDFDYFRIGGQLTGEGSSASVLQAELGDVADVIGVQNMELEVPVRMNALPEGNYNSIKASFNIPKNLKVSGVTFNTENIRGEATYTFAEGRLQLQVAGDHVHFSNDSSNLFATIELKVEGFVPSDQTVQIRTDYIQVEGGNVSYDVHNAIADVGLKLFDTEAIAKIPGYANPLMDHKLGADPYALVYDGRVYIYMSSDSYEYDENGNIKGNSFANLNKVHLISSADMVNWTDHGAIPVAGPNGSGIAKWAYFSWAPAAAHKKINGQDKFFLYFANGAGGIGVLTADSPIGPWSDPLGKALISGDTPGVPGVVWLFDPAVLVDDDGKGYLYFGGGIPGGENPTQEQIANPKTGRVMELGDDMISTVGSAAVIDAPFLFEDSGIHKYNGKYYYSYCSNFSGTHPPGSPPPGEIAYMVSDSPMGPFEYVSPILKNPYEFFGVGGNNHHAIFEFEEEWYVVYHAQTVSKELLGDGMGYRSPHINKVEFYENGMIKPIKGDREGISQLRAIDPYKRTEAETIAWNAGILTDLTNAPGGQLESLNLQVTDVHNGDWISIAGADFGDKGAASFEASVAAGAGGEIEIRIDSPIGEVIGKLEVGKSSGEPSWQSLKTEVANVKGVHNIFLMFKGTSEENLFNLDYWAFTAKEGGEDPGEEPGGGGYYPSTPPASGNSDVEVLINGKSIGAGKAVTSTREDQSVTTVTLDSEKLKQWLTEEKDGTVVTIPVNADSDVVIGQLQGPAVQALASKNAIIELMTERGKYSIPAAALIEQLSANVDLEAIALQIEISVPADTMVNVVEKSAEQAGLTLVIPPVDFTIRVMQGENSVEIAKFNSFIERLIAIPDGVDIDRITTAVVVNPDGTLRHVPTKIVIVDGMPYASVNSLTNSVYAVVYNQATFKDVEKHWAKVYINDLASRMVLSGKGDGLFKPESSITRAEFAAIIVRGLGLKPIQAAAPFSDVREEDWFNEAVTTAYSYGLISGFEDGTFRPSGSITREQAMVILAKAMTLTGLNATLEDLSADEILSKFSDAGEAASWAKEAIADNIQSGIISGRGEEVLAPKSTITRAEVAKIVQQLLVQSDLI
ncbi:family 43 glycosylhydrolase [Paenibacillus sp. LHD-117]|uniref:family 43 glycosylhydrolase n=1 Tax=Paenibacillus sp. LHD-117 TaxID=3071412 RepID=UPI0027DF2598|nr:family 43 glycosylhydrolase [Paenibacillus sp. LHD-117]MDQ6417896.1 family 43 glycosylhydrolase [Paenibacillus sp. LHD-117]